MVAGQLEMSPATLYRELNFLERSGFIENPKKGMYQLTKKGVPLAQITLTTEEIFTLAFTRSLLGEEFLPLRTLLHALLDRATASLAPPLRELLTQTATKIGTPPAGRDYKHVPWLRLMQACAECITIEMDYDSTNTGRTKRLFDPYRIAVEGNTWLMQGWCHRNQAIRSFALDKVHTATLTGQPFTRNEAVWATFAAAEGVFAGLRGGSPLAVRVRFDTEVAAYALKPGRWPLGLNIVQEPDGTALLTGTASGTEGIIPELLRWRHHAYVEGGQELQAAFAAEVAALHRLYFADITQP